MNAAFKLCVATLVVGTLAGATPSCLFTNVFKTLLDCKEETGPTDEDTSDLFRGKIPDSVAVRQFLVCGLNELKIMVDGNFSAEGAFELNRKLSEEIEFLPRMEKAVEFGREVTEICAAALTDKAAPNEEEMAINIFRCFSKTAKKLFFQLINEDQK